MKIVAQQFNAVRPIPIKIITVSKGSNKSSKAFSDEWAVKLKRYTQLTEINIKTNPLNAKEVEIAVKTEADRVLKAIIPTTDRLIVLDERGTHISSEEIADMLLKASDDGCSCLVFAIGGPYGHGGAVREAAFQTVSLSKMVMNHQVANVVLLEQLYRAWTILKNEPYHH